MSDEKQEDQKSSVLDLQPVAEAAETPQVLSGSVSDLEASERPTPIPPLSGEELEVKLAKAVDQDLRASVIRSPGLCPEPTMDRPVLRNPEPVSEATAKAVETALFLQGFISALEPITRWPCPHCGRKSEDKPLRLVRVRTEDGRTTHEGCWYCAIVERFVLRAKKLLG